MCCWVSRRPFAWSSQGTADSFFWFGTLVGGGTLLLLGALPRQAVRGGRLMAVLLGAALGIPATAWTLLLPVLALTVIVLTLMSLAEPADPARGT
jgi:hypothetical protein